MSIREFFEKEVALLPANFLKYSILIFAALSLVLHFSATYTEMAIKELTTEYYSAIPFHQAYLENIEQILRQGKYIQIMASAFISLIVSFKLTNQNRCLRKIKEESERG
ncbi:MAG: hypothetical protein GX817_04215 [Elusimicrobia bacterium]|nr:hypothetical protein [Elusimicrobiota bacterium]